MENNKPYGDIEGIITLTGDKLVKRNPAAHVEKFICERTETTAETKEGEQ